MAADAALSRNRAALGVFGAVAGLSLWYLVDRIEAPEAPLRLLLLATAFASAYFGAALVMSGPIGLRRAVLWALPGAALAALLLFWASFRFDEVEDFLAAWHPAFAWSVLAAIPVPFLIARARLGNGRRTYPELFSQAWSIVVRGVTGWLFVGLFWLVYFLSDALLELVGLNLLDRMAEQGWFVFTLTGLVLGLAMAVLNELSAYLSPGLVLRLLRLLLPVVTAVTALFLLMVPLRGLEQVFGGLSAAATLLAMAIAGITLVTSALDETDATAARHPLMRGSAQVLSVLLPVLAGLAGWAVWLRVAQYGWTPDRLLAALAALVTLLYALLYAGAVLRGGRWMARIRRGNVTLALGLIGLAALWLTPVLNAERISAESQVARYLEGRTPVAGLDLWALGREWGRPGQAALARLEAAADAPEAAALAQRIAAMRAASNSYEFGQLGGSGGAGAEIAARVAARMPVRPEGAAPPEGMLAALQVYTLDRLEQACARSLPDGRPACAMIVADLNPHWPGDEALIVTDGGGGFTDVMLLHRDPAGGPGAPEGGWMDFGVEYLGDRFAAESGAETIARVLDGGFTIRPSGLSEVVIGGTTLLPRP